MNNMNNMNKICTSGASITCPFKPSAVPSTPLTLNLSQLSPYDKKSIKTYTHSQYISNDLSLKRVILNFIKGAGNNTFKGVKLDKYTPLLKFLNGFDDNIYFSRQSFSNYRRLKSVRFELYILNHKVHSFIEYVKEIYPHFKED